MDVVQDPIDLPIDKLVSAARRRILETADRLFYQEGIRAIGVDRVIRESPVTRATFYRHFASKEALVVAYLSGRDRVIRRQFDQAQATVGEPVALLNLVMQGVSAEICSPLARGCPFINAAAEYPAVDHPVRQLVSNHRAWFRGTLITLLRAAEHPNPEVAAGTLVLLRDGAMVGGYLDDQTTVTAVLANAVAQIVDQVSSI